MNKVAINIHVQAFYRSVFSFLLYKYLAVQFPGHRVGIGLAKQVPPFPTPTSTEGES